jgi:single-stranded DNA-specific DHH superfamily exonuclease
MLTDIQIEEIREHLNNAQNPVFFFDNDQDGLCSFLLLQKYIGRGKGFPIKTSPALTKDYFRKVEEFNSDYIFILDKPEVAEDFVREVEKKNIPIIWIDHHDTPKEKIPEYITYYNPLIGENKTNEPVTYICYQITKRKEDLWLAVVGCISDNLVPDFYKEFMKDFPDLCIDETDAFNIFYGSDIGKIARILGFGLKDKISNVIAMIKFLISCKTPYDFLEENNRSKAVHKRFHEVDKKYQKILDKAKKYVVSKNQKIIFFKYAGNTSMSSDIANGLKYAFPDKIIVVVYTKGFKANISGRGKDIKKIILRAIEGLENSTGGGHENAVGAQIRKEDIVEFEKRIKKFIV